MKKERIQFIKKFNLARSLARFDSLSLLGNTSGFALAAWLARPFVRPSGADSLQRFRDFLNAENNPVLEVISREFFASSPEWYESLPPFAEKVLPGSILFKSNDGFRDDSFLTSAAGLMASRYPHLSGALPWLRRRLRLVSDLRFYGAELETLQEAAAGFEGSFSVEIDWINSGKHRLFFSGVETLLQTETLSPQAQQNLLRVWFGLFYEKHFFPADIRSVLVNGRQQVCLADFDLLYPLDSELQKFPYRHLVKHRQPKTFEEYKLAFALFRLKQLTPSADILPFLIAEPLPLTTETETVRDDLSLYADRGLLLSPHSELSEPEPQKLAWLLDSARFKKDPVFRKSSALYYVPLLIVIILLLTFFS